MSNQQTFRFSTEELKKINILLPKGFKFITREELQKKETQRPVPKKRTPPPPPPTLPSVFPESVTPPVVKVKIEKEPQYYIQAKPVVVEPPISVPIEDIPAGTSKILLDRIKRHPAYSHLYNFKKVNESDQSLRQIEEKVNTLGELYRTADLQADLQQFFLTVYKHSVRTSSEYRQATQLDNHLLNLMKVQRGGEPKKLETRGGQGGRKRLPQVRVYQPLASYKVATTSQKRQLGMMIRKLSSQNLQQVIYIMFESSEVKEYTFDLDNIHIKKFRELEEYVKKCMEKNPEWDPRTMEDEQFSYESEFIIENDDS